MYIDEKTGSTQIKELEIEQGLAYILLVSDATSHDAITCKTRLLNSPLKESTLIQDNKLEIIKEFGQIGEGFTITNEAADGVEGFKTITRIPVTISGNTFAFSKNEKVSLTLTGLDATKTYKVYAVEGFAISTPASYDDLFRLTSGTITPGQTEAPINVEDFTSIIVKKDEFKEIELNIPGREKTLKYERVEAIDMHYSANDIVESIAATLTVGVGSYLIINVAFAKNVRLEAQDNSGITYYLV